jgi:hypothetical protein
MPEPFLHLSPRVDFSRELALSLQSVMPYRNTPQYSLQPLASIAFSSVAKLQPIEKSHEL